MTAGILAFFRVTLPRWHTGTFVGLLKPYILSQCHKRLISGIQRTELFPLLNTQREGLRWSRLFDYTPHLVSTAAILRIWLRILLEAPGFFGTALSSTTTSGGQYSGKFKLKFVLILMVHPIYVSLHGLM